MNNICRVLSISRATYYNTLKPASKYAVPQVRDNSRRVINSIVPSKGLEFIRALADSREKTYISKAMSIE